ncbi:mucin-17-like [Adelges cooleyi]|uniref:mucin-17-like n=1 Tax=Adelges cooleyi TaxID=133065 RepID=UPI00217FCBFF|nr:mucin-17-like [Adelges cooleyi]
MGNFRVQMTAIATIVAILAMTDPAVSRSVNISNAWLYPQNGFMVFYRHFRDKVTWFEADAVCQFHHAQLATIETNRQFEAMRSYLKELDVDENVWIGLKRNSDTTEFTWTNYQPLVKNGYFREEVPRSSQPLCVVSDPMANFKWHSMHCGGPDVASFVCELPVPTWASKGNGCMTNLDESMTITFLPELPAVQLTRECSPGVSKNVNCKGNMKQVDILEQLSCPTSEKMLDAMYKAEKSATMDENIYYQTTTTDADIVEDYAIEMATIPQYNDDQSISKVIGHGSGGIVNLPQEMSFVQEPIKASNRGIESNRIETSMDRSTAAPSTTAKSSAGTTTTVTAKTTVKPSTASTTVAPKTPSPTAAGTTATASTVVNPTKGPVTSTGTTTTTATTPTTTGPTTTTEKGATVTVTTVKPVASTTPTPTLAATVGSKATTTTVTAAPPTAAAASTVSATAAAVPVPTKRNSAIAPVIAGTKGITTTARPSRVPVTIPTTAATTGSTAASSSTPKPIAQKSTEQPIRVNKKIDLPQIPMDQHYHRKGPNTAGTTRSAVASFAATTITAKSVAVTATAATVSPTKTMGVAVNTTTITANTTPAMTMTPKVQQQITITTPSTSTITAAGTPTTTTTTAKSSSTVAANNHHKTYYDAYTEHPNHSRHIVRQAQPHHSYPYILYRLLG